MRQQKQPRGIITIIIIIVVIIVIHVHKRFVLVSSVWGPGTLVGYLAGPWN